MSADDYEDDGDSEDYPGFELPESDLTLDVYTSVAIEIVESLDQFVYGGEELDSSTTVYDNLDVERYLKELHPDGEVDDDLVNLTNTDYMEDEFHPIYGNQISDIASLQYNVTENGIEFGIEADIHEEGDDLALNEEGKIAFWGSFNEDWIKTHADDYLEDEDAENLYQLLEQEQEHQVEAQTNDAEEESRKSILGGFLDYLDISGSLFSKDEGDQPGTVTEVDGESQSEAVTEMDEEEDEFETDDLEEQELDQEPTTPSREDSETYYDEEPFVAPFDSE